MDHPNSVFPQLDIGLIPHHKNPLRFELGLVGQFVVMFTESGYREIGKTLCHHVRHLLECRDDITFIVSNFDLTEIEVQRYNVSDQIYNWPANRDDSERWVKYLLSLADLHILNPPNDYVNSYINGWLSGIMAAGRPLIWTGTDYNEYVKVICNQQAGFAKPCDRYNEEQLAHFILNIVTNRNKRLEMGKQALHIAREEIIGA